jgi:uncharacterized delta-60 repeat protein
VLLLLAAAVAAPAQGAPGDLDLTFSGDGRQTTGFGFGVGSAAAILRQPDGKIIAVGADEGHGAGSNFALARYNADGSLDPSFSGDGKRRTSFGGSDFANGVAIQADGKIVAAGGGLGTDLTSDFALARYLLSGARVEARRHRPPHGARTGLASLKRGEKQAPSDAQEPGQIGHSPPRPGIPGGL